MNKKFLVAWLVLFILYMAGGYIVHELLLHDDYAATGLMRAPEDAAKLFPLMILAHVMLSGAFVWIYARGVENKPWLGQGLRYGLAIAFVAAIPLYIIYYVVQPLPQDLVVKQVVFDTICLLVLGSVVAFLYRGQGR
jgi:hypothetical protein